MHKQAFLAVIGIACGASFAAAEECLPGFAPASIVLAQTSGSAAGTASGAVGAYAAPGAALRAPIVAQGDTSARVPASARAGNLGGPSAQRAAGVARSNSSDSYDGTARKLAVSGRTTSGDYDAARKLAVSGRTSSGDYDAARKLAVSGRTSSGDYGDAAPKLGVSRGIQPAGDTVPKLGVSRTASGDYGDAARKLAVSGRTSSGDYDAARKLGVSRSVQPTGDTVPKLGASRSASSGDYDNSTRRLAVSGRTTSGDYGDVAPRLGGSRGISPAADTAKKTQADPILLGAVDENDRAPARARAFTPDAFATPPVSARRGITEFGVAPSQ